MAENSHKVLIGARGCLHPDWVGAFYPDDLPADWRLAYYANEFNLLVIEWAQLENTLTLMEDVADEFRFVVELPVSVDEQHLSTYVARLQQAGKHCAGVIVETEQSGVCEVFAKTIPCYIEGESNLIKIQAGASLKELRVMMEKALKAESLFPVLFVVDGEPADVELLRNAKIMFELL